MTRESGFTIVEILISIALLSILVVAIALPILNFQKLNIQSRNSLSATSQAQQNLEKVRQLVINNYSYAPPLTATQLGDVTCTNISVLNAAMPESDCSLNRNPPMRRLSVTKRITDQDQPVTLTVDVRP